MRTRIRKAKKTDSHKSHAIILRIMDPSIKMIAYQNENNFSDINPDNNSIHRVFVGLLVF